jgi:predicted P-loop ATPase
MDERYRSHNIEISKWLNAAKRVYNHFDEIEDDLEKFFSLNCKNPID